MGDKFSLSEGDVHLFSFHGCEHTSSTCLLKVLDRNWEGKLSEHCRTAEGHSIHGFKESLEFSFPYTILSPDSVSLLTDRTFVCPAFYKGTIIQQRHKCNARTPVSLFSSFHSPSAKVEAHPITTPPFRPARHTILYLPPPSIPNLPSRTIPSRNSPSSSSPNSTPPCTTMRNIPTT